MKRLLLVMLVVVLAGVGLSATVPALAGELPTSDVPTLGERDVMPHVAELQAIADRHGGNRAHGTPGFAASVRYVRTVLERACYRTRVQSFQHEGKVGQNLIADWPGGDESRTVFLGAHLDSAAEGPGMNDNASGTAAVLATAVAVSKAKLGTREHLRFAFWGAEEAGLIGSDAYLRLLTAAQRKQVQVYLNFDMTGTPDNQAWLVSDLGNEASTVLKNHFTSRNLPILEVGAGGSDHQKFDEYGVPVSGFSTGLDDCYHLPCDRIDRVSPKTQLTSANAIIGTTWALVTR
jgi:hypothetical protein